MYLDEYGVKIDNTLSISFETGLKQGDLSCPQYLFVDLTIEKLRVMKTGEGGILINQNRVTALRVC